MPLKGKHLIAEIEGIRCTVVETGLNESRVIFLKDLLIHNNFEVKTEAEKTKEGTLTGTFILGVTDLEFNPVVRLYQKKLFRHDGKVVTPSYWNSGSTENDDLPYYEVKPNS